MSRLPRLLVTEDEAGIQELLRYTLLSSGFDAVVVGSAEDAMAEIRRQLPTALLLDSNLPGMSGPALARRLRAEKRTRDLPILMVTANAEESDRVQGLDLGADDYITKPFSPRELVSRIRAVLRRRYPHKSGMALEAGHVRLDPASHVVSVRGKAVDLSPTEYDLLLYLMSYPNTVFTRDQLLNALHGDHRFLEARTIDVYIRRLRSALGPTGYAMIETVRGFGYKLIAPEE